MEEMLCDFSLRGRGGGCVVGQKYWIHSKCPTLRGFPLEFQEKISAIIIPLFKCQAKIAVNKPLNGDTKINL